MNKYIYLAKNVGVLALSQFGTKLLSFFLLPLYTSVLTTEEYGNYDLFYTTISLLVPFLTLNIVDASLRFAMDMDYDNKDVFTISAIYLLRGSGIALILLGVNHFFQLVPTLDSYGIFLWLLFLSTTVCNMLTNFSRGIDKVKEVAISSVICSIVMIGCNILFLIPFRMGLSGYFLATILGYLAQIIYLIVGVKAWKYISFKVVDKKLEESMLGYCKPMILNGIAWWINSASDRYIVTWFCGIAVNGIYSVGYKIPSILNIFQTIFSQAWTLSAVHDFDAEDSSGFFSKMYNLYNMAMTIMCSVLIISTRVLAKILYAKDFYSAWQYVPFLMIAIVFGALSGYIGGIFTAVKNSKIFANSSVIGAFVNLVLNIVLVNFIGALGAAVATAVSYWVVWVIRVHHMKKCIKIRLFLLRDYLSYGILIIQAILLLFFVHDTSILYSIELILFLFEMFLYKKEIKSLIVPLIQTGKAK